MVNVTRPELLDKLKEAQFNLKDAGSDESGGFHNKTHLMVPLNNAIRDHKKSLPLREIEEVKSTDRIWV